jgi:hypothetical protein
VQNDNLIDNLLTGVPADINKKKASAASKKKEKKQDDQNEIRAGFVKSSISVRKTYYDQLKMEAIRQNRFVWQVLDDAIAQFLKQK